MVLCLWQIKTEVAVAHFTTEYCSFLLAEGLMGKILIQRGLLSILFLVSKKSDNFSV